MIKRRRSLTYVRLTKNEKCSGCKACGFGKKNYLDMPALCEIDCKAGDTVTIALPEKQVKGAYLYLYLLPLAFMFAGLMIGYTHGERIMFLGAAIGLTISIPVVYVIERLFRKSKKYLPTVLQVISETDTMSDITHNFSINKQENNSQKETNND